jgi:phosphatidylethanolamine/phosphatidyl-N-methylethanolamine N-methyltransferase
VDQEYSTRYYAFLAPAYDWIFGRSLDEGRREAALRVRRGDKVLEVGVGTGLGLKYYPGGCHVVGVDICRQMLRRARWRAWNGSNGSQVVVKRMDATRLAFPDGFFDVIVAPYVITTVGDPTRMCSEMHRVCRSGGRVIVVSNTREDGLFGRIKCAVSPVMEKIGFTTDLDVELILEGSGLRVVETRRVNLLGIHRLFVTEKT